MLQESDVMEYHDSLPESTRTAVCDRRVFIRIKKEAADERSGFARRRPRGPGAQAMEPHGTAGRIRKRAAHRPLGDPPARDEYRVFRRRRRHLASTITVETGHEQQGACRLGCTGFDGRFVQPARHFLPSPDLIGHRGS